MGGSVGVRNPNLEKGEIEMLIDARETGLPGCDICVAYVHGSTEDKTHQTAKIRAYWSRDMLRDSEFVSEWAEVERKLAQTEPKSRFMLIVSDLLVLSRDPEEWAERVILFRETGALLCSINSEHESWVRRNVASAPGMTFTPESRANILLFLQNQYCGLLEEARKVAGGQ